MSDAQLLAEFTEAQSSQAFTALVQRYIDLVYGAARRTVGDGHLAEDVTQSAFVVLAKKAKKIDPATLPGWLVNTTRLAAKEAMRMKMCRERHEKEAGRMRSEIGPPRDEPAAEDLASLLDDALSRLSEADRSVVAMRFLQGRSFAEVGMAMGTSEEAARKRVSRAVEKLRSIFMKQGFIPSAGGLMLVLASRQASRAPASLIRTVCTAASDGGKSGSMVLAKGVVSTMTFAKVKLATMVIVIVILTIGLGVGLQTIRGAASDQKELPNITVRLVGPDGKPVKDATLGSYVDWSDAGIDGDARPRPDIGFFGPRARIVSDEAGTATITAKQLFDGGKTSMVYALSSDHLWVGLQQVRADPALRDIPIQLEPACRLFGNAVTTDLGDKAVLTHADLSQTGTELQICCNSNQHRFEFLLPSGRYTINAFAQENVNPPQKPRMTSPAHKTVVILPGSHEQKSDVQINGPLKGN